MKGLVSHKEERPPLCVRMHELRLVGGGGGGPDDRHHQHIAAGGRRLPVRVSNERYEPFASLSIRSERHTSSSSFLHCPLRHVVAKAHPSRAVFVTEGSRCTLCSRNLLSHRLPGAFFRSFTRNPARKPPPPSGADLRVPPREGTRVELYYNGAPSPRSSLVRVSVWASSANRTTHPARPLLCESPRTLLLSLACLTRAQEPCPPRPLLTPTHARARTHTHTTGIDTREVAAVIHQLGPGVGGDSDGALNPLRRHPCCVCPLPALAATLAAAATRAGRPPPPPPPPRRRPPLPCRRSLPSCRPVLDSLSLC
jgi:hypothetical protein